MSEQQQTLSLQQAINLAVQHHNEGRLPQAESLYQQILQTDPNQPVALHLLGVVAYQTGKNDLAVDRITEALNLKPDYAEAHSNLGNALKKLGRLEDAAVSYRKALGLKPDYAEAHNNLGNALWGLGKPDDAVTSYRKALDLKPDYADAHNNLGNALQGLGNLDDAVASYRKAITINPDYAMAHSNLGVTLRDLGKLEEAMTSYHRALDLKPDYAEAHNNLGSALQEFGKPEEAVTSYHKALALSPEYAEAHNNLGSALQRLGKIDEAAKQIDLALSHQPGKAGWRIKKALLLPIIPYSKQDTQVRRDTLAKAVKDLMKQNLTVSNPLLEVGTTHFYLAYHNQNNRGLLEDIAKMHIAVCPKLTYEAKHCRPEQRREKDILQIGFLSAFLRDHTVGQHFRGIIGHFSRAKFEVIIFRPPGKKDHMSEVIDRAADKVVTLYGRLERDWKIIEKEKLDVLFYLDIGMDSYTYFLSFARLAPVQAVTIGHAETSGVPNVDYFLSSEVSELPGADDHYSERLIKLKFLPTFYYQPEVPVKPYTRSDFDLPEGVRLYVYAHSLFKLHPGFDETLGKLLRRDPDGRLIIVDDPVGGHWTKLVLERFHRSFPDVAKNVISIPRLPYEKFIGLLMIADALLDNPFISGTSAGLLSLGVAAPIVAWPGELCSGRCVTACYKQMGLSELIATDEESFLELVLRLAQDSDFKQRIQSEIKTNAHKLYERLEVVREMEDFFIAAHEAWKRGDTLTEWS